MDRAGETWWFRARSGGCLRSFVDDLEFDEDVGDQVAAVSMPVCRDDEVIGVLRTKLSLGRILHMISALDLGGDRVHFDPGSAAIHVFDLEDNRRREVTTADASLER